LTSQGYKLALEGNLCDISLEHIFQLVHTGEKTGTLHILRAQGEAEAFVYFRNGKIFGAVSDFNRVPIGERLIEAGCITEENLAHTLELQNKDEKRRKIGQILVAEGLITPEILKKIVREQIQSTVFDLIPWEEGEFQFLPNLPAVEDIGLLVNAKKILLESNQRRGEWDRVQEQVPSVGAVFAISDKAADYQDHSLSQEHWKLLRYIDGKRNVTELALMSKKSEFATSALLSDLADSGLLKLLCVKEKKEPIKPEPAELKVGSTVKEDKDSSSIAVSEDNPASAPLDKRKQEEILTQLDIEGLNNMVAKELSVHRRDFINELAALTDDNLLIGNVFAENVKLEQIDAARAIDADSLEKAILKLKSKS